MRQPSTTSNASGPIYGRDQREADGPAGTSPIAELDLTDEEARQVRDLAAEVCDVVRSGPSGTDLLAALESRRERVPKRIRARLALLKSDDPVDCLIVHGLDVDEAGLPPTPSDWRAADRQSTRTQETQALLIAGCLGQPFGWADQQGGRLVDDVVPVKADEHHQMSSSSREAVSWHTEDAFQPDRTDYVGLLGLRNRDGVRTGVSCAREWVPDTRLDPLFTTPVTQLSDLAHEGEARTRTGPALFGDPRMPYVRLDPHYLRRPLPPDVQGALAVLDTVVERTMRRVAIGAGDVLLVDNVRAVHSRESFVPRYDGTDRWLKRMTISRDPRRTWSGQAGSADDG